MALADLIVVEVVRRSDFYATGAKLGVDIFVRDDWHLASGQRQNELLANQAGIALIRRVDRNRDVAEHGFGTRCGDNQSGAAIRSRVANFPDAPGLFFAVDFEIGDRRAQYRIPVDQSFATIYQALFVQFYEHLDDRL